MAGLESTSIQQLSLMQQQLNLDTMRYQLELETHAEGRKDWLEDMAERRLEREAREKERGLEREASEEHAGDELQRIETDSSWLHVMAGRQPRFLTLAQTTCGSRIAPKTSHYNPPETPNRSSACYCKIAPATRVRS